MNNTINRRVSLVAVIACLLGAGHDQITAQSFKVGTYNLRIAGGNGREPEPGAEPGRFEQWNLYNWVLTRRFLVFDAIEQAQPDIMGFQEAFQRSGPLQVGPTQQEALGELFVDTKWTYLSWGPQDANNMNPIIVNTERFSIVASDTVTVDMVDYLGAVDWDDYHALHEFFHADPSGNAHSLSPLRYVNWVVADDLVTGARVAFLTSHYETFIGSNKRGPDFAVEFQRFTDLVNGSFGYVSEEMVAQGEVLKNAWGPLEVIIGGDFETGDPELPSQKKFEDAGFVETWRVENGDGRRPTQGIDVMFVKPENVTIDDSYYDQAAYTDDASDHKPLYAELILAALPVPVAFEVVAFDVEGGCTLQWATELGWDYTIQFSANLEVWEVLGTITGDGAVQQMVDSATDQVRRFYRISRLQ